MDNSSNVIEEMVRELASRWCLSRLHGRGVPEGMTYDRSIPLLQLIAAGDEALGIEPGDERLATVEHYLRWHYSPAAVEKTLRRIKAYSLVREHLDDEATPAQRDRFASIADEYLGGQQ